MEFTKLSYLHIFLKKAKPKMYRFLLLVSTILAIIALFLNLAVRTGLNQAQKVRLSELRAQNQAQCNETLFILDMLPAPNGTVDQTRIPQLLACESYVRERNPALKNASDVRLQELLAFNDTVQGRLDVLLPALQDASDELNVLRMSLNDTGVIDMYQAGTVSVFNYSTRSITLGGTERYYIDLPAIPELLEVTMNMTGELLLDDWMPAIGSGCMGNCTRQDLILDRQQEKVMTVPTPIMFDSRSYPGDTDVLLNGNANVMAGSFVGISDAVHLSF